MHSKSDSESEYWAPKEDSIAESFEDTPTPPQSIAKRSLETQWTSQYSCSQEDTDGYAGHTLGQMADYWQSIGIPDYIGSLPMNATLW